MNPGRPVEGKRARPLFSTRKPQKAEPVVLPMLDRVLQSVALAIALTLALAIACNPLGRVWHAVLDGLLRWLALDAEVQVRTIRFGQTVLGLRMGVAMETPLPDWRTQILHAVMCVGIFGLTWAIRSMPLRCGLRILCGLHGIGLLMIALHGDNFPYRLLDHTRVLYDASLICLMLTPSLLAAGFFLFERSWLNRFAASALIIGFQAIGLPVKLAMHSLLVGLLSPAAIPVLFLAAGPVLDILLLAALYSWVLTWPQLVPDTRRAPQRAG